MLRQGFHDWFFREIAEQRVLCPARRSPPMLRRSSNLNRNRPGGRIIRVMTLSLSGRVVATAFAAIALAFALMSGARAADPIFPAGSRVGLVPPAGLIAAATYQGFEDRRLGVTLAVTELSARSYPDIVKEFSPEEMRAGGLQEESRENVTLRDGAGFIVIARQSLGGVAVRKWALVATLQDVVAVVLIVVPDPARGLSGCRPARGTRHRHGAPQGADRAAACPAALPLRRPWRISHRAGAARRHRASDLGPDDFAVAEQQPFMMVLAQAAEIPPPTERDAFARRVLANAWPLGNARFVRSEGIRIGNAPAHEIVVETRSTKTNTDFTAVQWLLFGSGSYLQIVGAARRELWDEMWPRMHKVRDGIAPK